MSDRELLEKAAKAAEVDWFRRTDGGMWLKSGGIWNPLTDDGDALRLAVKLRMCVSPYEYVTNQHVFIEIDDAADDPYAATRRAIVRAAAQIGKEMT